MRKKKELTDKDKETDFLGEQSAGQNGTSISNTEQSMETSNAYKDNDILNTSSDQIQDSANPAPDDESEILMLETDNARVSLPQNMDCKKSSNVNDDLYGKSDSSGDEQLAATNEVDFKVSSLVSAIANNNNLIQELCWLLKFYKSNSISTNHCIISILQRISDDLELSPMLYQVKNLKYYFNSCLGVICKYIYHLKFYGLTMQLSFLTTFYGILDEQKSCPCKEYANIVDFLTSLVRKMLKKMKKQPLLFVEILFWKTRKECHYINAEYLLHELGHLKKESKCWGNFTGDGDIGSSQADGWTRINISDALGEDEADVVISHELGNEE